MTERIDYRGYVIEIRQDDDAQSPEDWGNDDLFLGESHRRGHALGREGMNLSEAERHISFGEGPWRFDVDDRDCATEQELREMWEEQYDSEFEVFPVRLRNYGSHGCHMTMSEHDGADGYIFVRVPNTVAGKLAATSPHYNGSAFSDAESAAEALLSAWNTYLEGDVWCVSTSQKRVCSECSTEHLDMIDSLGGIYGYQEAIREAQEMIDFTIKKIKESA